MTALQPPGPTNLPPGEHAMNRPTLRRAAPIVALLLTTFCGGSPSEHFDARAPDVPFIDQYKPAGRNASYDGTENCGPAILAGIAKARGLSAGLSDADLINRLARVAGTDATGTSGHGMVAGLQYLGMWTDAKAGADLGWIDHELASGHDVIANGDFYSVPGRQNPARRAGHYIAITAAMDGWSSYKVTDPADGKVTSMTDSQIQKFIRSHPQGGFTISGW
jgi:hypothetical protein